MTPRQADKRSADTDEFYIGWLSPPPAYRRFVRWSAAGSLVLAGLAAAAIALGQRTPGKGIWDPDSQAMVGLIQPVPYPVLLLPADRGHPRGRAVLLVSEGKFGAARRAAPFAGRLVRARGTLLTRDGRSMLELATQADALELVGGESELTRETPNPHAPHGGRRVALRGEVIDPKCYLGAMKPGDGKTHKACAALCIRGGIPPMLLSTGPDGRSNYYLLAGLADEPLHERLAPFAGDRVAVSGTVWLLGDLPVLSIDANSLERL
jgi:hypothetical protein